MNLESGFYAGVSAGDCMSQAEKYLLDPAARDFAISLAAAENRVLFGGASFHIPMAEFDFGKRFSVRFSECSEYLCNTARALASDIVVTVSAFIGKTLSRVFRPFRRSAARRLNIIHKPFSLRI